MSERVESTQSLSAVIEAWKPWTGTIGEAARAVPLSFLPAPPQAPNRDCIVISFHGSIDRSKRPVPAFNHSLAEETGLASIAVADPVLQRHPSLTNGWYLGDRHMDPLERLVEVIVELCAGRDDFRFVTLGSSGGGYAALKVATQLPRSMCLAVNPQTDPRRHHGRAWGRYVDEVWNGSVPERIGERLEVADCWNSSSLSGVAIILQEASDWHHVKDHLAISLSRVGSQSNQIPLPIVFPWSGEGHRSPPRAVLRQWLSLCTLCLSGFDNSGEVSIKNVVQGLKILNGSPEVSDSELSECLARSERQACSPHERSNHDH
jgi:hypothetical protein